MENHKSYRRFTNLLIEFHPSSFHHTSVYYTAHALVYDRARLKSSTVGFNLKRHQRLKTMNIDEANYKS